MPAKKAAKTPDSAATPPASTAKKAAAKKAPLASPVAKKASKAAAKTAPKAESKALATSAASREEIEKAAYLNYRSRKEKNLPGDAHADWIEAERKLTDCL